VTSFPLHNPAVSFPPLSQPRHALHKPAHPSHEDVIRLDVAVDAEMRVEVGQALERLAQDVGYARLQLPVVLLSGGEGEWQKKGGRERSES